MARITHVKKAQQRYKSVPVLNEDGTQKMTPVMSTRTGEQKVTKTGRPVFLKVTEDDKSQPLPNRKCEKCGTEIEVGQPYKHVTPKSGPYGGRTRYRCATCPTWQYWDLSNSLSARIAQIQDTYSVTIALEDDVDTVQENLTNAAEEIRSLAEEKREAAQNIEDGFQHATSMSDELNEIADSLESWADEVEGTDIPEKPEEVEEPDVFTDEEPEYGTEAADPEEESEEHAAWQASYDAYEEAQSEYDAYEDELSTWADDATSALADALGDSPV